MPNIYHIACHDENHEKNLQITYSQDFSQIKIHVFIIKLAIHCIMVMYLQSNCCVIPENIHSQPKVVIGNSKGWGSKTKKHPWKRRGGGGGLWIFPGTTHSKKSLT